MIDIRNILQIYEILKRIETDNHSAKRTEVYTKKQIKLRYARKQRDLIDVIQRIDTTNPSRLDYSVSIQNYKGKDMYFFEFEFEENKKLGIPNRKFMFHLPLGSIDVTKIKKYKGEISYDEEHNRRDTEQ